MHDPTKDIAEERWEWEGLYGEKGQQMQLVVVGASRDENGLPGWEDVRVGADESGIGEYVDVTPEVAALLREAPRMLAQLEWARDWIQAQMRRSNCVFMRELCEINETIAAARGKA